MLTSVHPRPVRPHRWPCLTWSDILAKCLLSSLPFMALTTSPLPSHQLRMYRGHQALLGGSDLGPRDLEEFSLPAPQHHPWPAIPAFHVFLARKACTGLALSPAPRGPWVQGHSHPVHDGVLFPPPWGGKRCRSSAWRFTACAAPSPDLAAHLGLLCRCTRSIP